MRYHTEQCRESSGVDASPARVWFKSLYSPTISKPPSLVTSRQRKRPEKYLPSHSSSKFARRATYSDKAPTNQEIFDKRFRSLAIFSLSSAKAFTCSSVGSIQFPSSTRLP